MIAFLGNDEMICERSIKILIDLSIEMQIQQGNELRLAGTTSLLYLHHDGALQF